METGNETNRSDREKHQVIILIVGQKGCGKSALIKMEKLKEFDRVVVIDHREEYAGCRCVDIKNLRHLAGHIKNKRIFRVRVGRNFEDDFNDLMDFCYAVGDMTIIIEEIPRVIPLSNEKLDGPIGDIIFRGRHQNINVIGICQRASMININLRSQADIFCSFRQTEREDVKKVCDLANIDEEELRSLPVGEYFEVTFSGVRRKEVKRLKKILS